MKRRKQAGSPYLCTHRIFSCTLSFLAQPEPLAVFPLAYTDQPPFGNVLKDACADGADAVFKGLAVRQIPDLPAAPPAVIADGAVDGRRALRREHDLAHGRIASDGQLLIRLYREIRTGEDAGYTGKRRTGSLFHRLLKSRLWDRLAHRRSGGGTGRTRRLRTRRAALIKLFFLQADRLNSIPYAGNPAHSDVPGYAEHKINPSPEAPFYVFCQAGQNDSDSQNRSALDGPALRLFRHQSPVGKGKAKAIDRAKKKIDKRIGEVDSGKFDVDTLEFMSMRSYSDRGFESDYKDMYRHLEKPKDFRERVYIKYLSDKKELALRRISEMDNGNKAQ